MEELEIKITGSGTAVEIATKLKELSEMMLASFYADGGKSLDGAELEDFILMTEINVKN
ncbi:MAG TPA: hypothetical protein VIH28_06990 [Ignavibacteriaceae bacterium]